MPKWFVRNKIFILYDTEALFLHAALIICNNLSAFETFHFLVPK